MLLFFVAFARFSAYNIFGMGYWFKMVGINTELYTAQVVEGHTFRNRSYMYFPGCAMGKDSTPIS